MQENRHLFGESEKVRNRAIEKIAVYVDATTRTGGGLLVANGIVLANHHVLKDSKKVMVYRTMHSSNRRKTDKCEAKVLLTDENADLTALAVSFRTEEYPVISQEVKAKHPVVMVMPVWSKGKVSLVTFDGRIEEVTPSLVYAQMLTQMGSCGSGIYDARGTLLAMADTDVDIPSAQAIHGKVLKSFLRRVQKKLRDKSRGYPNQPAQTELPFPEQGNLL